MVGGLGVGEMGWGLGRPKAPWYRMFIYHNYYYFRPHVENTLKLEGRFSVRKRKAKADAPSHLP